jgi:CspA family cold shock protein
MDGYKTLKAGQSVTFDIVQGPKGLHAVNICGAGATASKVEVQPVESIVQA